MCRQNTKPTNSSQMCKCVAEWTGLGPAFIRPALGGGAVARGHRSTTKPLGSVKSQVGSRSRGSGVLVGACPRGSGRGGGAPP